VAYVAGRIVSGSTANSLYDYARSKHAMFSGNIDGQTVSIYDHERGCHFGGTLPGLYDYGRGVHVQLNINGDRFTGYDYGDTEHFSGTVNGQQVQVYDYGESKYTLMESDGS
jgi:hypothetical protein